MQDESVCQKIIYHIVSLDHHKSAITKTKNTNVCTAIVITYM